MMASAHVKVVARLADDASWCRVVGARLRKEGEEQEEEEVEEEQQQQQQEQEEREERESV